MPGTGDSRPSMALRSRDIEAPAGDWVLPGGYPESDESLAACAQRELAEETGLQRTVHPRGTPKPGSSCPRLCLESG
jgi:8-oxo-dGTP pyrophosphatase MutT (NUDIX family)